jgi:hypothetical protein
MRNYHWSSSTTAANPSGMHDDEQDIRDHVLRTWEAWSRGDARA